MAKMTNLEKQDIETIANLPYDWEKLKSKTIMISGGTGFVGTFITNVIRFRNEKFGDHVKIVSLSRRGGLSDDTVEYMKADINNKIEYEGRVDYILHLASNTHPKQYADHPVETITTNVIGCNNLLQCAVEKKVERFLLTSSVEIYGQGSEKPMAENYCGYIDCNSARSGYNEAKRTSEALCQSYRQQYGVDCTIVRLARVFGHDKKVDTKAMSQFMNKALSGEDIILKSKGNQRYSYIYIADAASAVIKVLLDGADGEAYNAAAEDEGFSLGDFADYIANLAGKKVIYQMEENKSVSQAVFALMDCKKIEEIGWMPKYCICEALKRTYEIGRTIK
jgi:nucleoside-diphosphate-sugar epimerase